MKKARIKIIQYWSVVLGGCGIFLMAGAIFINVRSCMRVSSLDAIPEPEITKVKVSPDNNIRLKLKYSQTVEEVDKILGFRKGWSVTDYLDGSQQWHYYDPLNDNNNLDLVFYDYKLRMITYSKDNAIVVNFEGKDHIVPDPVTTKY